MIPIYRDRLRLDVMVTNTFAAILTLRPDHPEALKALAERHEAHGRWADLIDVLQPPGGGQRRPDGEGAPLPPRRRACGPTSWPSSRTRSGALEKILEIDPGEETARRRLREIYTRGRSWRPLLELMRRELRLLPQAQHGGHLATMAEIAADRLAAPREAIGLWNEVLELAPREPTALAALAKLYEKEGRWAAAGRDPGPAGGGRWARTPRRAASCSSGAASILHGEAGRHRGRRGHPAQGARGRAGEPAGAAGAARDPRQHRQLRGPRGACTPSAAPGTSCTRR